MFLPFGLETFAGETIDIGYVTTRSVLTVDAILAVTNDGQTSSAGIIDLGSANTGQLRWTVPGNTAEGIYQIAIRAKAPASAFTLSIDFTIRRKHPLSRYILNRQQGGLLSSAVMVRSMNKQAVYLVFCAQLVPFR